MPIKVNLLPRAQTDLAALPFHIQDQIIAKLELLRDFPEMGASMCDAFSGFRALLAARNTYRVVYRVAAPDLIEVAYVRHCARQTYLRAITGC